MIGEIYFAELQDIEMDDAMLQNAAGGVSSVILKKAGEVVK